MNIFNRFEAEFETITAQMRVDGELPSALDTGRVVFELPRDASHGDLACNAAMVLAKPAGMKPRDLATIFARHLQAIDGVTDIEIAGPGFINIRVAPQLWADELTAIIAAGDSYGRNDIGKGRSVNVEYVSANPTGPLHAAHARGAVLGDVMAELLAFSGWNVTREYYTNDAGSQVDVLARSAYLRYCEALGDDIGDIPPGLYPGTYLADVGVALAEEVGHLYRGKDESEWLAPVRDFAIHSIMAGIAGDLKALGIKMDRFSSERALVETGAVQAAVDRLLAQNDVYRGILEPPKGKEPEDWEPREQLLFRASEFGDDTDRPLQKSDGTWTYFASDVAYHMDKLDRTKGPLINIFGADHSGYVKRMKAAVAALSGQKDMLDIRLCQLVNLMENGKPVKMSKRAGTFVTVRDVIDAVGADVIRFIMLTRRSDQTLDFDYAKVTEQSRDNPVFYVQYAHARACSVLRQPGINGEDVTGAGDAALDRLTSPAEMAVIKALASWPRLVVSAAQSHEPHRVAFYLMDLAASFHALWTAGREAPELRFIRDDDAGLTAARLCLVKATALVIRSGLGVLSIQAREEM
ncbi:MAG TPA: arginine--tRNA ligase [Alphaproteobacteria bacterium]|jgi:arginyl-tRNA synthetase|nr:arginine--tRNA ligase [Rhodospirillaceae bacterium]HBP71957.1 arginine--tRNA ligase [Alphaproteobacteria bacterium]|tara:strand:- start:1432 stop:3171 length:1740 start_codon:yes stop_codon:yes gene_type:complete